MKEKKNKKQLILSLGIVGVLLVACIGAFLYSMLRNGQLNFLWGNGDKQEAELKDYKIYWNVDGKEYMQASSNGITTREMEDGCFRVKFSIDGEEVIYKVMNMRLMNEIDGSDLMGLSINEEGFIQEMISLEDMGATIVGEQFYVASMEDKKIRLDSSSGYDGVSLELQRKKGMQVFDVSEYADKIGASTELIEGDRVLAIANASDEITHVYTTQRSEIFGSEQIFCEHCQKMVYFRKWKFTNRLPNMQGHYQLDTDVKVSRQVNISADNTVVLDLNGHTAVAPETSRVYATYEERSGLVIMDNSKEQTGTIKVSGKAPSGGCVWVRYGTFAMYGGTLDARDTNDTKGMGLALKTEKYTEAYIYGGTIYGGKTTCGLKDDMNGTTGGIGGAVHIGGTLTMNGGIIKNGVAKAYYVKNKNSYAGGKGGNVAVAASGVFTMNGGEILEGRSETGGGNIFLYTGAVFNMNGGTISGGKNINLGKNGGNIWVNAGSTMNMTNGVIEKGICEASGGNMALYGTLNMSGGTIQDGRIVRNNKFYEAGKSHNIYFQKGTLNMSGGRIAGYLQVIKNTKTPAVLKLSGTAQINGKPVNLYLPSGVNIDVSGLKKGANIYVTALGFFSNKTAAGNEQYMFSDYDDTDIVYAEKKLYAGQQHCICGGWHLDAEGNRVDGHYGKCNGELVLWKPWTKTNVLPRESGNWYLTKDVELTVQMNLVKNSEVYVDLNGKKVTQVAKADALEDGKYGENRRIYSQHLGNTKLVLLDTSEARSGSLVPIGTESLQGNCIWINNNSACEIYAGIYDASNVTAKGKGVAISVEKNSTLAIYGGTIKGGTAVKSVAEDGVIDNGRGGTVYVAGRVDMYDGLITGGKADFTGGNIYVYTNGSFYMHGGVVENGEANKATADEHTLANASGGGGNIYAAYGTVEITDGVIRGGSAVNNGGSIYIASAAKLNILGGQIIGGKTSANGGNLAVMGSIKMTDGLVAEGSSKNSRNYNAFCNISSDEATFDMTGGIIKGGTEIGSGNKATLNFGGDIVVFDKQTGPNLYLYDGDYINLTGFKEGAKISITKKGYGNQEGVDGLISTATATASDLNYVFADGTKSTVKLTADNRLTLYNPSVEEVNWISWPTETSGNTMPTESGYYQLTKDITLGAQWNVPASAKIVVNLNGKTITGAEGKRVCSLASGSTLTIQDNSEGAKGKIVMNVNEEQVYTAQGGVMLLAAGSTLELKTGILDASKYHVKNSGAAVYISNDATFKMTGGTVVGGTVYTSDNGTKRYGGSIYVAGKGSSGVKGGALIMQGGTVSGGTAGSASDELSGGNIFMSSDATFTMSGGTVKDGMAYGKGGNIYVGSGSTFAMKAGANGTGTVSGGVSKSQGGNIYVATGNEIVMEAGLITTGTAKTHGGNIYLQERTGSASAGYKVTKFTMNGGTISSGRTTDTGSAEYGGGNVYVPTYAEFYMNEGAIISDGISAAGGGNVHVNGVGAKFVMNNATITGGVASNYGTSTVKSRSGGSISVRNKAIFEMSGEKSLVSGGTTEKEAGGNIAVFRGNLNITGGTVKDGTSSNTTKHGNIFVNNTKKDDADDSQYSITIKGCIFALKNDAENKGVNLKTVYNTEQDCDY